MIPDYDRQVNPRWPNPTEGPTQRARRVAGMYRALLRAHAPHLADQADGTAGSFGETWMIEQPRVVEPDRELTTAEAAALVNVTPNMIHKWADLDDPTSPGRKLLPRFKKRGRDRTWLAGDVLGAATTLRKHQHRYNPG